MKKLHFLYLQIFQDIWDIPTVRWSVLNPDQILPIPHYAFKALSLRVRASFAISTDILRYLRYSHYKQWSVLNPDQILPIPHLAFSLHVKASFSPQNISAASKRAPKWFMIGSMSVQYFSSSLRSKEGAQYYGTFTFWKGELFTSCVAGYFWKYTSFVTCVDSPGYIALHIQIVQAGNRTKKEK